MSDEGISNELAVGKLVARFPGVEWVSSKQHEDGFWWVKFHIDFDKPASLTIVQALAHILNAVSLSDPLPTRFFPTSSPPYMNGGPKAHLHWVIEPFSREVSANDVFAALDSTLMHNIESKQSWLDYPAEDEE